MTEPPAAVPYDPRVAAALAGLTAAEVERVRWPRGIDLEVTNFYSERLPPLDLVTRVRAILVKAGRILVFDGTDGWSHIVPGGGIEAGETILEALRREVWEEVRCVMDGEPRLLGLSLFHNLGPRLPDLPAHYPYPDFLQLIYGATTSSEAAAGTDPAVRRPRFAEPAEVMAMHVPPTQLAFVEVALKAVT
ncbi:MAG: NUDIX domain-containing protein [Chloroflexota bacterium]|nr:NUDIX domain-containing protein [Chloroflexota bacterium]MDE3192920.1 NUDIX domain-containing protein [Chloroflexota bacterium]